MKLLRIFDANAKNNWTSTSGRRTPEVGEILRTAL